MAGRRVATGLALAALALTAAGCGFRSSTKTVVVHHTRTVTTTVTVTTTPATTTTSTTGAAACTGSALSGTFTLVPGTAAAGQISYVLTLTNESSSHCYVSGRPAAVLLDSHGSALPTHITANGVAGGSQVMLAPGVATTASARFSPDVPGTGDSQNGPCQPKAHTLQVTPNGGGTLNAPIQPPTSVCEQGALAFSSYH